MYCAYYCRCSEHGEFNLMECDLNVCEIMMRVWIYVLELVNGKYYVGKTLNNGQRMNSHFNGKGSNWTKLYEPLRIIDVKEIVEGTWTDWELWSNHHEKEKTLEIMREYGWENVRGAGWCKVDMQEPGEFVRARKDKERLEKKFRKMIEEAIIKDEKLCEKIEKRLRSKIEKRLKEEAKEEDKVVKYLKKKGIDLNKTTKRVFDTTTGVFKVVPIKS